MDVLLREILLYRTRGQSRLRIEMAPCPLRVSIKIDASIVISRTGWSNRGLGKLEIPGIPASFLESPDPGPGVVAALDRLSVSGALPGSRGHLCRY